MELFILVTFLVGLSMAKVKIEKGNREHLVPITEIPVSNRP
jgi:hypothetical protein